MLAQLHCKHLFETQVISAAISGLPELRIMVRVQLLFLHKLPYSAVFIGKRVYQSAPFLMVMGEVTLSGKCSAQYTKGIASYILLWVEL